MTAVKCFTLLETGFTKKLARVYAIKGVEAAGLSYLCPYFALTVKKCEMISQTTQKTCDPQKGK